MHELPGWVSFSSRAQCKTDGYLETVIPITSPKPETRNQHQHIITSYLGLQRDPQDPHAHRFTQLTPISRRDRSPDNLLGDSCSAGLVVSHPSYLERRKIQFTPRSLRRTRIPKHAVSERPTQYLGRPFPVPWPPSPHSNFARIHGTNEKTVPTPPSSVPYDATQTIRDIRPIAVSAGCSGTGIFLPRAKGFFCHDRCSAVYPLDTLPQ